MIRVGILSNPRSHRNKRGLPALIRQMRAHGDPLHAEVTGPADIDAALAEFAAAEVGLVVVNGGDGTVQAALTTLFGRRPFAEPPLLAVLRGGMTNMIALDVGLRGRRAPALARLLRRARDGGADLRIADRHLLRLEPEPGAEALFGMFFGTAAVCRAIDATRSGLESRGIEATAAAGAMLAGVVASHVMGRRGNAAILSGDAIDVAFDGAPAGIPRDWLLAIVTTLDRLLLRGRPYWGREAAALRFTGVHFPAPRLARAILPVLYGRGAALGPDYVSRNAETIAFTMRCPYTLDGEMFTPAADRPVILSDGGIARFVQS